MFSRFLLEASPSEGLQMVFLFNKNVSFSKIYQWDFGRGAFLPKDDVEHRNLCTGALCDFPQGMSGRYGLCGSWDVRGWMSRAFTVVS